MLSSQVEPNVTLTTTPNEGYGFQHWIVTGYYMPGHGGNPSMDSTVITQNPLNVECGKDIPTIIKQYLPQWKVTELTAIEMETLTEEVVQNLLTH